jgi:CDP-glucose 4,6-dehydratase
MDADGLHEAHQLKLDSGKARRLLGWQPKLSLSEAVTMTVRWYREASSVDAARLRSFSVDQIRHYEGLLVTT